MTTSQFLEGGKPGQAQEASSPPMNVGNRLVAGAALVVLAYFVANTAAFIAWLQMMTVLTVPSTAWQPLFVTMQILAALLGLAGVAVLPDRLANRVAAGALLILAVAGMNAFQAYLNAESSQLGLETVSALSRLSSMLYLPALVAVWVVARRRSVRAIAIVVPATAVLWFILTLVLQALPREAVVPVATLVRTALLVTMVWAAWAIDNRARLKSIFQTAPAMSSHPEGAVAPAPVQSGTSGMAIAAFVLALIIPLVGLILGYVARAQLQREGGQGGGLAQAAIIISWVFVGLWSAGVLLFILLAASTTAP